MGVMNETRTTDPTFPSLTLSGGTIRLRDLTEADVDACVAYWHDNDPELLRLLNIDLDKLGSPEETRARFLSMRRTGDREQPAVAFAVSLDERLIGYVNINRQGSDAFPHVHIFDPSARSQGCFTLLLSQTLQLLFDLYPLERIIIETRTRVAPVNRALERYLPPEETRWVDDPDGLAGPGMFHRRTVRPEDLPRLLRRGEILLRDWTS
jgi:RimJ/RimL family protein N-acetyltransferase